MTPETTIIGVLGGTITTLAAVIAYLYRDSAHQATEREIRQQEKVEEVLRTFSATLSQMSGTIAMLAETQKKVAEYVTELAITARAHAAKTGQPSP